MQIFERLPASPELSNRTQDILCALLAICHSARERESRIQNSTKARMLVNRQQQGELYRRYS